MTRKPVSVVGVVTPFKFPIALPAWKIAPALAYGNAVLWKPASTVPLLAMRLAQVLDEAELTLGVLTLLIGPGSLGSSIVKNLALDALTFTGSIGIGRALAGEAAGRGVPVQAEMVGKNAAVFLADADLELAAEQVMLGAFLSAGQKCTDASRLIVAETVADDFLALLKEHADALTVGDPTNPDVHMGPVINDGARKSISSGINVATSQGA